MQAKGGKAAERHAQQQQLRAALRLQLVQRARLLRRLPRL